MKKISALLFCSALFAGGVQAQDQYTLTQYDANVVAIVIYDNIAHSSDSKAEITNVIFTLNGDTLDMSYIYYVDTEKPKDVPHFDLSSLCHPITTDTGLAINKFKNVNHYSITEVYDYKSGEKVVYSTPCA
ncbi:hypothetical protein L0B53_15675 [Vibrio sp. SS-MA-C1-2]|uniref:hypothetical protein n=1 Tax=Vibrio sp. SS-MA-C1-2 TaxID=2908646 RepID=UPI001F34C802|nr:hypothetical protein [Vibrio sp. SS-MA-C1-2]UJF18445.1 hypothetical protein L0B53_15675 [Vibrio sp. SS-MA-C1-2]